MDEVITQLGLLLSQTRFARRALEDIERATAQYSSYALTAALTPAGTAPLLNGALRVHVVNLADLTPSGGFGDTIASLLGGVASFIGNLVGGAVGGTVGSMRLAFSMDAIKEVAVRVERIIDKLGLFKTVAGTDPKESTTDASAAAAAAVTKAAATTAAPQGAGGGLDFLNQLTMLKTRLAAATGPQLGRGAAAANEAGPPVVATSTDAEQYRSLLSSLTVTLESATRAIGVLTMAIPTAIAALAWLLDRLPDVRNAITDTLRFVVRSALVLRGAVIVLGLETIAMLARVAAMAVRTLADTITGAIAALFTALAKLLDGALQLAGVLGTAILKTIEQVLNWLVPTVDQILRNLGELNIFKLVYKLTDIAHYFFGAAQEKSKTAAPPANPQDPATAVTASKSKPPATLAELMKAAPDLTALMNQASANAKTATDKIQTAATEFVTKTALVVDHGLTTLADKLTKAETTEAAGLDTKLGTRLTDIAKNAADSAEQLLPTSPALPDTVFHPIAAAYGRWLSDGGLDTLLTKMSGFFTNPESTPPTPTRATPSAADLPTVQIGEVIIDITGPPAPQSSTQPTQPEWDEDDSLLSPTRYDLDRLDSQYRFDELRGSRGRRRPHVPII
jgi:hypothetical protein